MEEKTPEPFWKRNTHLIVGAIVTMAALIAIAGLQFRSTDTRQAADSVQELTFDIVGSLRNGAPSASTTALHQKLLSAIDAAESTPGAEAARSELVESGPAAIGGDAAMADRYGIALNSASRAVVGNARRSSVRTQQIQMGIVAAAAITLILLIRDVAAKQQPQVKRRRSRTYPSQIDPLTGLGQFDTIRIRLTELLEANKPGLGFVALLAVGIQPEHEHFLPLTRAQLDASLAETSRRLRTAVRATDTVARLARDELAVALPSSPRVEDPGRVASKILAALDAPIVVGTVTVLPNPRVGIAISPVDAVTPDGLIQRARLARRAASDSPAAVYRSYSDELAPSELGSLQMLADLRSALAADDGQLWVAYQPKIDLNDERVVGFEALARWDHPQRGSIAPSDFIRVAEESDLIITLGAWVLDKVCAQMAAWGQHLAEPLPVSVNVSGRQFERAGLADLIRATLARHGVAPHLLELELTEGILLEDRWDLIAMMRDLRDLGVKIAVDDFGTGYSALSYLKRFPIDVLKIDRTFIREIHGDDGDEAISTAIISMAHSMALQVVAEGVETPEQLQILRSIGCDTAQGFYFAHPARPAEIQHRTA
ncbi:MAG: GGDEF domain-containing protein [bacterium]|nr:GGDEF domain-containing protein [bacterium]